MDPQNSKLEKTQNRLYSKNYKKRDDDVVLRPKDYNLDNDWKKDEVPAVKTSEGNENQESGPDMNTPPLKPKKSKLSILYWILLVTASVFFVGSLLYAGFIFLRNNNVAAGEDVSINIVGPVSIGGGEKLSLDVIIQNNNEVALELADLVAEFPAGTKQADDSVSDLKRLRQEIGEIPPGSVVRKTVSSVLFGEENSTQNLSFFVEYQIKDSNAIFQKKKDFEIVLNASPVRLTIEGLSEISSGQQIELDVKMTSNSNKKLDNVILDVDYPFGFIFEDSDIKPSERNNVWIFETLEPEEEKQIKIRGTIEGQNEEERFFRFNSGLVNEESPKEIGIIFNTATHSTVIKKSFVDLALTINGQQRDNGEVFVESGESNVGILQFTNNTNDTIRDLDIRIGIVGPVLDEKTVTGDRAFYNSIDNVIVWNSETSDEFFEIPPRKNITLQFRFKTFDLKSGNVALKNPEIKVSAKVTGNRVSEDSAEEEINSSRAALVKVLSDVAVRSYTEFEEGPFENTGPIPPKVETQTSYTVVLEVKNNTNDLSEAKIEATIPSYVSWNSKTDPVTENVSFDVASRKIVWSLGDVPSGIGYSVPAKKLFVNLTLLPSASQIGDAPDLLRNIKFSATDDFTGSTLFQEIKEGPNTRINGKGITDPHQKVVE